MTSIGQTICLCMIVKDEAQVIRRCLASVRPIVNFWIVIDTGSNDKTRDIVCEVMADLPGMLIERPWRDFAYNRTEALRSARHHGHYTLIIDADDTLHLPPNFHMPNLDADAYMIEIIDSECTYQRAQIVRSDLNWRYRGVLHELLICDDSVSSISTLPIKMLRNHDGARRRDPLTYYRDVQVLEKALTQETDRFMISRYTFYLAQSYRDAGERERALHYYLLRANQGLWDQEIFVALLQAGRLMETLGQNLNAILDVYRRASATCPMRAEAAHAASRLCRLNNRFTEGCSIASPALVLSVPAGGLFVEAWIYEYGLRDEYAVNAYGAGLHRECLSSCLDILGRSDLPEADRSRITVNARFALDRLTERLRLSNQGRRGLL